MKPVLTVLAGANGAGKSFFSDFFIKIRWLSSQPVNIDALEDRIDKARIPEDYMRYQHRISHEIDRVYNELCQEAIQNNHDFSFECNLRKEQLSCINLFENAGYSISLIYLWIDNIEISRQRVQTRINEGGHPVDDESIVFNFENGLNNLDYSVSRNHWDHVFIVDNSKDGKGRGDTLSLLLELKSGGIVQISDNFFSPDRERLLPKLCGFLKDKVSN